MQRFMLVLSLAMIGILAAAPARAVERIINTIVAVVNDDVILSSDLDEKVFFIRQQLQAQGTAPPPNNILRKQVLERLISDQLQLQMAEHQGIRISDEMLNESLERMAEQNKMTLKQFKVTVEKEGFDFARVRENHRRDMTLYSLRQRRVGSRITVTEQEVENFLATQAVQGNVDDEFRLSHILVSIPEGASSEQISATKERAQQILKRVREGADFSQVAVAESDGQNALEGGDLGWRKGGELPTPFVPVVTAMSIGDVSELIRTPSGFHIIKLTDLRGGPKHLITQYEVRHILMTPSAIQTEHEVVTRLEDVKQRIENGAIFADLAKALSQDKISAGAGGELGWVSPGEMAPDFEAVMQRTPVGKLSKPFQTRYGWHILEVTAKRDRDNTDEYKKSKARELIRERKFNEELQSWLRELRDEAYVDIRLDKTADL